MGRYIEENLGRKEVIIKEAEKNKLILVVKWIFGILFCWLLLIPLVKAIVATIEFSHVELALTNKKIIGREGAFNTRTLEAPLSKIQNVGTNRSVFGKMFNYGDIVITTAGGRFYFSGIKNVNAFKKKVMSQIDKFEESRIKDQDQRLSKEYLTDYNNSDVSED